MLRDTERHLYTFCSHTEVSTIRSEAEENVRRLVAENPEGLIKTVSKRLQSLLLDPETRHRTWKGIITPEQVRMISGGTNDISLVDMSSRHMVRKALMNCLKVVGAALMAMRKVAWGAGGPVIVKQHWKPLKDSQQGSERGKSGSILALLGVMSPKEAVCWELNRRARRASKQVEGGGQGEMTVGEVVGNQQWDVH